MPSTALAADTGLPASRPTFLDPELLPIVYGMGVVGGCMSPEYPDGCRVKISKADPYAKGDVVVVWFKPEIIRPGEPPALIKRMLMMPPPWVRSFPFKEHPQSEVQAIMLLQRHDTPDRALSVRCADVIAVHKVIGLLTPEESYKVSADRFSRKPSKRRAAQ